VLIYKQDVQAGTGHNTTISNDQDILKYYPAIGPKKKMMMIMIKKKKKKKMMMMMKKWEKRRK
jgi:hypothetical protein